MIPVLNNSVEYYISNPSELVNDLVDLIGEELEGDADRSLGLRGGYANELNKVELEPSVLSIDSIDEEEWESLSGTSCIEFIGDWNYAGNKEIQDNWLEGIEQVLKMGYGDTEYISIVKGELDKEEICNDAMEVIITNAKVIAYIKR